MVLFGAWSILLSLPNGPKLHAQGLPLDWALEVVGDGDVGPRAMAVSQDNRVAVGGSLTGMADFDPGPGSAILGAPLDPFEGKAFVATYGPDGSLEWAISFNSSTSVNDVVFSPSGELWIGGAFYDTVDLDPGPGTDLYTTEFAQAFLVQLDVNGSWLQSIVPLGNDNTLVDDLAVAPNGDVLAGGEFEGDCDFDPGPGSTILSTSDINGDGFLVRYTAAGDLVFAYPFIGLTASHGIHFKSNGNFIFGANWLASSIDLDPGPGTAVFPSLGGVDGFWAEYDPTGAYVRGASIHGSILAMGLDAADNLALSGRCPDSMDIDVGPGSLWLYSGDGGVYEVYFAVFESGNVLAHAQVFEGTDVADPWAVGADALGQWYLSGRFRDSLDFNPGGTGGLFVSAGSFDAWLAGFNSNGSFRSGMALSNPEFNTFRDLQTNTTGGLWVCGEHGGPVDAAWDGPSNILNGGAGRSLFLVKYQDPAITAILDAPDVLPCRVQALKDALVIQVQQPGLGPVAVEAYDATGRLLGFAEGENRIQLDLPPAEGRMVLVRVRSLQEPAKRTAVHQVFVP